MANGDDMALWEWAFKGICGLLWLAIGVIMKIFAQRITDAQSEAEIANKSLGALELRVARETYTKTEVNDMVRDTRETCKRIFEVIDRLENKIDGVKRP